MNLTVINKFLSEFIKQNNNIFAKNNCQPQNVNIDKMNIGNLKTIVYYDCLDYPMTKEELEIFSFKSDGGQIGNDLIEEAGDFYFLKGRKSLIEIRKERNGLAKEKWGRALKAIKWLRMIPYIKLVFASGSLALSNTDKESDLDLLIIAKHGRIWTARSLAVFFLDLLGLLRRREQINAPDKICMNHFITDKSLYIPRKSIYTAQLYARLTAITGDEKLVSEFCEANKWVRGYIPKLKISKLQIPDSKFSNLIKKTGEKILDTKIGDWIEAIFRKYNLHRIKNYYLTYKSGGRVKADDDSLEFHPDSPELRIIERYNQKMVELGFGNMVKELDSGLSKE